MKYLRIAVALLAWIPLECSAIIGAGTSHLRAQNHHEGDQAKSAAEHDLETLSPLGAEAGAGHAEAPLRYVGQGFVDKLSRFSVNHWPSHHHMSLSAVIARVGRRDAGALAVDAMTFCSIATLVLLVYWAHAVRSCTAKKDAKTGISAADVEIAGSPEEGCEEQDLTTDPLALALRTAHTANPMELEASFCTSVSTARLGPDGCETAGLLETVARQRLLTVGLNRLTPPQKEHPLVLLLKQVFGGLFNLMLWICVLCELVLVLALGGDDFVTPFVLSAVIISSGLLQWHTERQAEGMMNALQELQDSSRIRTFRVFGSCSSSSSPPSQSAEVSLAADDLVPGDVIVLEAGQKVPADVRILACTDGTLVDNSALTGESVAEPRTSDAATEGVQQVEARNMAFCGTVVLQGKLICVVVATGDNTLLGKIASNIGKSRTRSSLEIQIEHFVHMIAVVAAVVGILSLIANIVSPRKRNVAEVLENAATAFFAQVPEGLLPTVTVCLMIASRKMAKRQVLVRKIDAVETLGCVEVLCSDKTGTLTSGCMTATDFVVPCGDAPGARLQEWPAAVAATVSYSANKQQAGASEALRTLARMGVLNCAAKRDLDGTVTGSPTEMAIMQQSCKVLHQHAEDVRSAHPQVFEIPFNSASKWMLTVHEVSEAEDAPAPRLKANFRAVLKGAPERVLARCDLSEALRAQVEASLERLMSQGKRVLCFAERSLEECGPSFQFQGADADTANFRMHDFEFKGLVALEDPPKRGAADAVEKVRRAGARTIMVTGDHPSTAEAIAQRIGVISGSGSEADQGREYRVITGAMLDDKLPDDEAVFDVAAMRQASPELLHFWEMCVQHTCVFARVSPMHKRAIVRAYQHVGGHITAMTGDGVNDAPALKEAEVGVAMGIRGTEVAKEAADIVLLDDDLQSVVAGMEQGRLCSDNLRKSIMYTLCSKLPQVLPTFAELVGVPSALTAAQVLLIDIGTDIWTAIAFAWQKAENELMDRPPRHPKKHRMVNSEVLVYSYCYVGMMQSFACWVVFFFVMPQMLNLFLQDKHPSEYTQAEVLADLSGMTAYYWTLVFGQVGAALAATTSKQSVFQAGGPNRWLSACIVMEIGLALLVVFWQPLQGPLKTRELSVSQLVAGLLGFALVFTVEEARKFFFRRRDMPASQTTKTDNEEDQDVTAFYSRAK